jgi:hypothetical protein
LGSYSLASTPEGTHILIEEANISQTGVASPKLANKTAFVTKPPSAALIDVDEAFAIFEAERAKFPSQFFRAKGSGVVDSPLASLLRLAGSAPQPKH